jgi:hypothetical protein
VGELGVVRKYYYWSDRKVREITANNDISLSTRWPWSLKTPSIPYFGQIEIGEQQRNLRRNELADKIETVIGHWAVEDLVTPPPVQFARGIGHLEFARFVGSYAANDGAIMHIQTRSSLGTRADICLFGSMDNFWGRIQRADYNPEGWTSSAWYAIEELLDTRGHENTSQWDDEESRAVEALKIALGQGITTHVSEHKDRPWTRGFTIGSVEDTEWFADIYVDVELTKDRWDFSPAEPEYGAERILIGAPVWVRTASSAPLTFYHADSDGSRRRKARK